MSRGHLQRAAQGGASDETELTETEADEVQQEAVEAGAWLPALSKDQLQRHCGALAESPTKEARIPNHFQAVHVNECNHESSSASKARGAVRPFPSSDKETEGCLNMFPAQ